MNTYFFLTSLFFLLYPLKGIYLLHSPYILSKSARTEVERFLETSSYKEARTLIEQLRQQFPWITHVTYTQLPSERITITLEIAHPFCAINTTDYVTTNGVIFPRTILRNEIYEILPVIIVPNISECSIFFGKEITLLPREFFNLYTITWYNKYHIILVNKNIECFPIITSLDRKITSQLVHYCTYIHKKIRETCTKKKKKKYALDVRFDKQIVLRPQEDIKYEQSLSS